MLKPKMQTSIQGRVFLVGCPRSGTTLLQSLLAAHPQIASFPESHFFRFLCRSRPVWRRALGLVSPATKQRFEKFLEDLNCQDTQAYLPKLPLQRHYVRAFNTLLDTLTYQQQKNIWLEKTPDHIRNITYIETQVDKAKFIHLIRNGADVVASLYDVRKKYSEQWRGECSIEQCVNKWIKDVKTSLQHLHKPNHILVCYEELVENPSLVLKELCQFISIEFDETMLKGYKSVAKQVTLPDEPWKKSVGDSIKSANGTKFYELFNEEQRAYILQQISQSGIEEQLQKFYRS